MGDGGDIIGVGEGGGGVEEGVWKGLVVLGPLSVKNSSDMLLWHILWVDCNSGESCDDRMEFASSILRASCTYCSNRHINQYDTETSAVM